MSTKMTDATQAEREANCRARLAKNRALPKDARLQATLDGFNYTFSGGFGGVYQVAKTGMTNTNLPEEVRALYAEAKDWGSMAHEMNRRDDVAMATVAAVKATQCVSQAGCLIAAGWVGDVGI